MNTIVVPVYNEGKIFEAWLPGLLKVAGEMGARVVVVDDGSVDNVQIPNTNVQILRHSVNCGVGAAVATGLEYAKRNGAEMVFTIDGDGQHDPEDLKALVKGLEIVGVDIVNGSRFLKSQSIPFSRRVANFLANVITFLLSGFWLTDTQSGMKGFSRHVLKKLEIRTPGYEWCSDIFREANWYGYSVKEVPISVHYDAYTMRKGQGFAIGLDMVMRLVVRSLIR